ncbi:hypothetical protein MIPYR_20373 [uncultured Microbacterium sp.]|uniref:Uncharacterized protein n=1 Tax=uncultured Microbacterium sp. TaxID=191216 RepID=A0A1Y5P7I7_9MICO|nr:hypothetical protein MIPYR_20373 [uncultured Microbacterium sp.]
MRGPAGLAPDAKPVNPLRATADLAQSGGMTHPLPGRDEHPPPPTPPEPQRLDNRQLRHTKPIPVPHRPPLGRAQGRG